MSEISGLAEGKKAQHKVCNVRIVKHGNAGGMVERAIGDSYHVHAICRLSIPIICLVSQSLQNLARHRTPDVRRDDRITGTSVRELDIQQRL